MEELAMARSATLFIQHRVRRSELTRYEDWLRIILAKAAEYPGHQGVHIIRPQPGDNEYSIVIRFATGADAGHWAGSVDRQQLLDQISDAIETGDRVQIRSGIDFWFTPAGGADSRAPAWKQWLVTTGVIWLLTMFVPPLFDPLFAAVPALGAWGIRHGILAAVIVALVVFLVMPWVTRVLKGWLFAQQKPAAR
jgi:antibiotic biosynthesis monooxygenase (ABM) superfamily enzyme